MIVVEIKKGYVDIRDGHGQRHAGWIDERPEYRNLPDPDLVYYHYKNAGYPDDAIIDIMLRLFHKQRIIRAGFLEVVPLTIGFVGPAGGGKSVGASGVVINDFLLPGIPVYSNMDIACTVRYRDAQKTFRTMVLDDESLFEFSNWDDMYSNVAVYIDELNLMMGDARRSMSGVNLAFSDVLQQRRKRGLNFIYSCQSEDWLDSRTRFATNVQVACRDLAYKDGIPTKKNIGRKSHWKVYDFSGIITGEILIERQYMNKTIVKPFAEFEFNNVPFWFSYDTKELQQRRNKFEKKQEESDIVIREGFELRAAKEKYKLGYQVYDQLSALGHSKMTLADVWDAIGVSDRAMQTKISMDLRAMNVPIIDFPKRKTVYFDRAEYDTDLQKYGILYG